MNYNNTDQQIHQLSQVLSKVGRTFATKKDDDSHTNVSFDAIDIRLLSRYIETPMKRVLLSLNLHNQAFEWMDEKKEVLQSVAYTNKLLNEVEIELENGLRRLGVKSTSFSEPMHYEIPVYSFVNEPVKALTEPDIKEWTMIRRMANMVCSELLGHLQVDAEIRIWPHHFDTGFYASVTDKIAIGFGFAMKDSLLNDSYFYMSGYPTEGNLDFTTTNNLPAGQWVSDDFKGALLGLSELDNFGDIETQRKIIGFLKASSHWYLRA